MLPEFSIDIASRLNESAEKFPVDLDLAWQWIGYSRKDKALEMLQSRFVVGIDYLPLKGELGTLAAPGVKHLYGLSVECFKMLGMMANTSKGSQIRRYFLECERIAKSTRKLTRVEMAQQLLICEPLHLINVWYSSKDSNKAAELNTFNYDRSSKTTKTDRLQCRWLGAIFY